MPFATPPSYDFGDGADVGSSTEVGNAALGPAAGEVSVTGLGAGTAAVFDGAELKERVAEAKALTLTDPTRGYSLEVQDDPAASTENQTLAYSEADTSPAAARYDLANGGVIKSMLPATLDGLELALAALGF